MQCNNGLCRTNVHAFPAQRASIEINVSQVVGYLDRSERTDFLTFTTTDAGYLTGFFSQGSLVFIHAIHVNSSGVGTFFAEFEKVFRTGTYTGTTRSASVLLHLGQAGFRIHRQGVKLTDCHAIGQTQTTPGAIRIASISS